MKKKLPKKPGVYIFKDKQKKIIYIGKSLSLKDRVKSYLTPKQQDPKTKLMMEQVASVDYQVVQSEFEALLLEANLIKEYHPKFNVRLKDNKRYLYIAITKSPFRVFPLRRPELEKDLLDWFGPFPSAKAVREVLRLLRRIFPYCSCRKISKRQCLYFHLKLCPGFKNLTNREYRQEINQIRKVLAGKTTFLLKNLKKKMVQAAKKLEFEGAQKYKNQISHLEQVTSGWRPIHADDLSSAEALLKLKKLLVKYQGISLMTLNKIEGFDVSNLDRSIIVGAMVAFIKGQPEKGLYRKFKINFQSISTQAKISFKKQNDPGSIKQIIRRRLNHPEWLYPQLILVDGGKPQVKAAFEAIKEKGLTNQVAVLGLSKRKETIVAPRIKNNQIVSWQLLFYSARSPVLKILQQVRDESHRFAQKYYHLLLSKKIKVL